MSIHPRPHSHSHTLAISKSYFFPSEFLTPFGTGCFFLFFPLSLFSLHKRPPGYFLVFFFLCSASTRGIWVGGFFLLCV